MSERKGTKGLELWCRKMTEGYPGVKIDNMTTSWRDGLAFCAIIHHFRPDLIEFNKLNKDDIYHNNELAFRVAEHNLGIPALLEPEDMVEYEVPDRLSILTYLSQFYQTFENQRGKSGARVAPKRPQSTPDHGIVSPASTSPPTKVQITIGRAKREPCAKCGLPVFIAERLNVGKLLYHRTCFRCARCNSQLTLANYYETENSEFCCEICPDEEKIISKKRSSEHSVLLRSMSDEEKSASLQTYSDAPDAYSTHFETALEYPIDGELKRNFTLTDAESTEFSKARSHFFKSQIEDSSDTGSEDIPPDLPQSKPPPFAKNNPGSVKTNNELVHRDSSFPSDKKDTDIVSDSVSEQTNDHFVTKDNASSTGGISVRARMKLFENNKDKKSDVNSYSSSKQVPFDSTQKKKAAVVAIDDLEDFDNISKKDINIEDTPLDKSSKSKKHSDKERNVDDDKLNNKNLDIHKNINLDLNQEHNFTSNRKNTITPNNLDVETKSETNDFPVAKHEAEVAPYKKEEPSVTEILDDSQENETSVITINSDKEEIHEILDSDEEASIIIIDDSPVVATYDAPASLVMVSDESFFSAGNITSPEANSSQDITVAKRGYYTAYEVLSPPENNSMSVKSDGNSPPITISVDTQPHDVITDLDDPVEDDPVDKRGYYSAYEVLSPPENNSMSVKSDSNYSPKKVSVDAQPQDFITDQVEPVEDIKRGYYTAYEVLSPPENNIMLVKSDGITPTIDTHAKDIITGQPDHVKDGSITKRGYYTAYEIKSSPVNSSVVLESDEISFPVDISADTQAKLNITADKINTTNDSMNNEYTNSLSSSELEGKTVSSTHDAEISFHNSIDLSDELTMPDKEAATEPINIKSQTENNDLSPIENQILSEEADINVPSDKIYPQTNNSVALRSDKTVISPHNKKEPEELSQSETSSNNNSDAKPDYPEVLNPFDDDAHEQTAAVSSSLNPFGEPDGNEDLIIPKPVSSARRKKKIIPSLEEREIKGTPEALQRIYIQRISNNPFEDDEDEEKELQEVSKKPLPSPRQKKKLIVPLNISLNPFESDEDSDKIVPVPAPRISKASPARPEPKARDTLSTTSRGSHGGSNSSISSGSAVGSARKKKAAPRPPLPFRSSEQPAPESLTISPNQSVAQSPNLSGTIRSRKAKRAPLPPSNASTPRTDQNGVAESLSPIEMSPVSLEITDTSQIKSAEDQIQSEKNVKDEKNRNRQSQHSDDPTSNENDTNLAMLNKSTSGRWKRRKGQAPSRPIPQKRTIKSLPMSEIKRELDTIEIQQQGLEKQGVRLEQIIREKCEGDEGTSADDQVPIEVEDLILQLFELVNEKNELFRRQAELMYLRRQQRLEEEHADVEYQIRCLMLQPELNKTDSDKAREEALINRLVEIVERRNEIIECLEMDRVREAEEDNSISSQLNLYSLKRESEKDQPKEQEKKEKKKKHKKLNKIIHTLHKHKEKEKDHKVDIDKDVDETEVNSSTEKKKKKKFNLF